MSKCKPTPTPELGKLEPYGVELTDSTVIKKSLNKSDRESRVVTITIPYDELRDNKEVQLAFQDLLFISTT